MSDELPDWPAETATGEGDDVIDTETPICDRIGDFLHRALNDRPSDLGPQIITKWVLVAEVQALSADTPTLRWFDSDIPSWQMKGLLQEVIDDVKEQRLLFSIASMVDDDEDDD